jgi:calcineurin-like phosphoesterase family protein
MSGNIFFISDLHLGHENMAKMRGFNSASEQDEYIINSWNSVVHKKDTVYVLGDVTMEKANYDILDRLLGYKKVIGGNHDSIQHTRKMLEHINSFGGCMKFRQKGFPSVILTHIPIHPTEFAHNYNRFKYNIHGHIHNGYKIHDPRYINVSAEAINYIPKTLGESINEKN